MQKFVIDVLIKVFQSEPVQNKLAEWKTDIIDYLRRELKSWIPIFVKTIVTSVAQSAGQLVVNTTDKVTDIIPGQLDDDIVDKIVPDVLDRLGDLIGIKLR